MIQLCVIRQPVLHFQHEVLFRLNNGLISMLLANLVPKGYKDLMSQGGKESSVNDKGESLAKVMRTLFKDI